MFEDTSKHEYQIVTHGDDREPIGYSVRDVLAETSYPHVAILDYWTIEKIDIVEAVFDKFGRAGIMAIMEIPLRENSVKLRFDSYMDLLEFTKDSNQIKSLIKITEL